MTAKRPRRGDRAAPDLLSLILVSRSGGGALRVIARLAAAWAFDGRRVRVITNLVDHSVWEDLPESVEVLPLPRLPRLTTKVPLVRGLLLCRFAIVAGVAIRRTARGAACETLLTFLPGTSLLVLAATVGLPVRVVVCERNDVTRQRMPWPIRLGRRLLYPWSDAITVNHPGSERAARRLARGVPVTVVRNPAPSLHGVRAEVGSSRTVLAVGRLVRQKDHEALLRSIAEPLAKREPKWALRIVGEGPLYAELREQVTTLDLAHHVTFAGYAADVDRHYQEAAFLVLTSRWEGIPNVVLEAQAHGLPVLLPATVANGTGLIADGEDGLVYDPASPGDLEHKLASLMSDDSLRIRLGIAAWGRAAQRLQEDTPGDWNRAIEPRATTHGCS